MEEMSAIRTFLVKSVVACGSTAAIVPMVLGIAVGDLDATMATYKLEILVLWGMNLWVIPLGYGGYKFIQYIRG